MFFTSNQNQQQFFLRPSIAAASNRLLPGSLCQYRETGSKALGFYEFCPVISRNIQLFSSRKLKYLHRVKNFPRNSKTRHEFRPFVYRVDGL